MYGKIIIMFRPFICSPIGLAGFAVSESTSVAKNRNEPNLSVLEAGGMSVLSRWGLIFCLTWKCVHAFTMHFN